MAADVARGDVVEPVRRRGDLLRGRTTGVAAPVVYLALSVWLFWPLVRHLRSAQMGGPDTSLFTWWLGWTPWAILHGHSPLLSTYVNTPHGVNAMWNTSVPLLGVVMSPVTLTLGPIATVNLLLVLAAPLSAWSAYGGARLLGLRPRTAFLVGFLYGFSTYVLAQGGSGHLHLAVAIFPPLVTALIYRVIAGTTSTRTGGLLIGLAGVLQIWISEEILATAGVVALVAFAILAVRAPREHVVVAARRLIRAGLWAALVVVPLSSPALYVQFFGAGHLSAGVDIPGIPADVFTAITPTGEVAAHFLFPQSLIQRIQVSNFDEVTGYIGLPVLVILVLCRRRIRETPFRWFWTPLVVAAFLAVGWTIRIAGYGTGLRGPGWLLNRLPVFSSIVAVRFSVYVVLFAALLVGIAWDTATLDTHRAQQAVTGLVVLAVLAVFPWPSANITRIEQPAAFAAHRPLPGLPDGALVAILPWPSTANDDAMRWQAVNQFHFRLVGAYGIIRGLHGEGDYGTTKPELDRVAYKLSHYLDGPPAPGSGRERQVLADIATIRRTAKALVIGPYGHPTGQKLVATYLTGLLHEQPTFSGGIYIFPSPTS